MIMLRRALILHVYSNYVTLILILSAILPSLPETSEVTFLLIPISTLRQVNNSRWFIGSSLALISRLHASKNVLAE